MKYIIIIILVLVSACSSSKVTEVKTEKERIHFKTPLLKYIHKRNVSKRTQLAYI